MFFENVTFQITTWDCRVTTLLTNKFRSIPIGKYFWTMYSSHVFFHVVIGYAYTTVFTYTFCSIISFFPSWELALHPGIKEVQITYRFFLVNCYLLHPFWIMPASQQRGRLSDWLNLSSLYRPESPPWKCVSLLAWDGRTPPDQIWVAKSPQLSCLSKNVKVLCA